MGPIKVDRIISISSEEQTNQAENILNISDPLQTWRCKAGEKQAIVILQFLETSIISSIDVGNNNSAFIEIYVGKSTSEEFQVLLVSSPLMTLQECKNGLNLNKVCVFNTDQLSTACNESWDRVKIVCTQPYIKQSSFGLSFITFHSKVLPQLVSVQQPISGLVQLGLFAINMDFNQESYVPGKLFDKHNENKTIMNNDALTRRINAPHQENDCALKDKPLSKTEYGKHTEANSIIDQHNRNGESSIPCSETEEHSRKKIKFKRLNLITQRPFKELFKRVVFAMSGIENPYHSVIHSKALEMGAIYRSVWDGSCTHLICGFKNAPMYQEVKRQGGYRIAKGDWIVECYANRRRVPWRRFALDKSEENQSESEDEILEYIPRPRSILYTPIARPEALLTLPSTNQFKNFGTSTIIEFQESVKRLEQKVAPPSSLFNDDAIPRQVLPISTFKTCKFHEGRRSECCYFLNAAEILGYNVSPDIIDLTDDASSQEPSPSTSQQKDMVHQDCKSIDLSISNAPTKIHKHGASPPTVNTDDALSKEPSPSTSQQKYMVHQDCRSIDLSISDAPTDIGSKLDTISDLSVEERCAQTKFTFNMFNGCLFYLSPSLLPEMNKKCRISIKSFKGKLGTKKNYNYIVSTDQNDLKLKNAYPPLWIWNCYCNREILSMTIKKTPKPS